jgi:hypothetical protein
MADTPNPNADLERALRDEDPIALSKAASLDDIQRLKEAETVLELRHQRQKRSSRLAIASQSIVALVAIGGFFANAYQSYMNKQQAAKQSQLDQDRWNREFQRAQSSDKYRAFFETSVLATDSSNPDKRLVGYALLQEFVADHDYNSKATLMLEESLMQELRSNSAEDGLDDAHANAVVAILTALSQTDDCTALERASRSIDRVARKRLQTQDIDGTREVFKAYVRRIFGRALRVCANIHDVGQVRQPLRELLLRVPELGDLKAPVTKAVVNKRIVEILRDRCKEEFAVAMSPECDEAFDRYAGLCTRPGRTPKPDDDPACATAVEAQAAFDKGGNHVEPAAASAPAK